MAAHAVFHLGAVRYHVDTTARRVETIFPDGLILAGCPEESEGYERRAVGRGYRDGWHMCRVHDFLHTATMQLLGWEWSPTLRAAAEGGQWYRAGDEESLIAAVERWLNGRGSEPEVPVGLVRERASKL